MSPSSRVDAPDRDAPRTAEGRLQRAARVLAVLTGLVLIGIGIRFLAVPQPAAKFFGIDPMAPIPALHHVIGLRDLWLGALAVILGLRRDWRALALWFGLAVVVCFADATIAFSSSGRALSVAFHAASGVFCGWLAWLCWRLGRRASGS